MRHNGKPKSDKGRRETAAHFLLADLESASYIPDFMRCYGMERRETELTANDTHKKNKTFFIYPLATHSKICYNTLI